MANKYSSPGKDFIDIQNSSIARSIENRFENCNLEFTSDFEGLEPIQAFGTLDGYRFYFRQRGNRSSLIVGLSNDGYGVRDAYPDTPLLKAEEIDTKLDLYNLMSKLLKNLEPVV